MSTRKIVINACFGGFSLSHEAVLRYAELKGVTVHTKPLGFGTGYLYATIPWDEMPEAPEPWHEETIEKRIAFNQAYAKHQFYDRDFPRDDPHLVQVVEELGAKASGECAKLKIVKIPDDVKWEISEYDGMESVEEVHRSWS